MLNAFVYAFFWLLFVAAQAQNSIRSTSNNLDGWSGFKRWLTFQSVNLATRASFCTVLYSTIVGTTASKVSSVGLTITATAIAAFAGYGSNAMLYQIFGYIPWLRVEIHDLAPAAPGLASLPTTTEKTGNA